MIGSLDRDTTVTPETPEKAATVRPDRRPRFYWVGTIAGVLLGAVFLLAVWGKALDPSGFAEQIRIEGLDFLLSAESVALIALALEAGLGLALLLGVRRKWVLVPTALLVVFFVFLTGRAWYLDSQGLRTETAGCGCFGNLVQRSPAEAFWQDLLLLVPPLGLAFLGRDRRLSPGVQVDQICVDQSENPLCLSTVAGDLMKGDHLVVIADLADPSFHQAVAGLNETAGDPEGPRVWVLSAATPEQVFSFRWSQGPIFQVVEAPAPLLRPLYRRLPRAFRVKDGEVTETWAGLPPV
jgi:uncharacterized membrane protein YphA (DoxX/SURF4 family)